MKLCCCSPDDEAADVLFYCRLHRLLIFQRPVVNLTFALCFTKVFTSVICICDTHEVGERMEDKCPPQQYRSRDRQVLRGEKPGRTYGMLSHRGKGQQRANKKTTTKTKRTEQAPLLSRRVKFGLPATDGSREK